MGEQAALERERDLLDLVRAVALGGGECVAQPDDLEVGMHARRQLGGGERLDEIVVGAGVEPLDGRLVAGAGESMITGVRCVRGFSRSRESSSGSRRFAAS